MNIAGTGHRELELNHHEYVRNTVKEILVDLEPELVITGMAKGFDLLLGEVATDLGLDVLAAVPFLEHLESGYQTDKTYRKIIDEAYNVELVSEPGYAAWKFHARNHYMVDRAELMLAYYNGAQSGGTYQCIKYALKKDVDVYNTYPELEGYVVEV